MVVDDENGREFEGTDLFQFEQEPGAGSSGDEPDAGLPERRLTILSVDDDRTFQSSLRLSLAGFSYRGLKPEVLTAQSATHAAKIIAERPDIAVALLDVVMETDDAGLRLVRTVREALGNSEMRIILLTGQPGMAPMQNSLEKLDISDYWLKTDVTNERLHSILVSNLRTWEQIVTLNRARRGLQIIVEASNSLTRATGFEDFSRRMIHELANLLGVSEDGIVCVREEQSPSGVRIMGSAGRFAPALNQTLVSLDDPAICDLVTRALREQTSIESEASQVLFFAGSDIFPRTAVYLATGRRLDDTERELLGVFATNIGSGLLNFALTSRLDRMAFEDELLGIPNGNALCRMLESALDAAVPRARTLLFIELDQYARSCVSLGVAQGDLMLKAIVARLRAAFPPPSVVARLHEDTFAILGHSDLLQGESMQWLEMEEGSADAPFIGVEVARMDLDQFEGSPESAIATGLLLVKRARQRGGNVVSEYEPESDAQTRQRFAQSRDLYRALKQKEIKAAFQPQVDLASRRILGAEVLARWTRPDGRSVPPGDFIPMAEANGMIVPLGRQIIEQACQALADLRDAGFGNLFLAVNVSPLQLDRIEFAAEVIASIEAYGLAPSQLELEITESTAVDDHMSAHMVLEKLREAGFPIAIDDFGTGYSSLKFLRALQPAKLKIDRAFVDQVTDPAGDKVITEMMIKLGKRLDMDVLAEGVETEEQAAWLIANGCDQAQGYFFGRPESFASFLARLNA